MRKPGEGIDCQGVLFYAAERLGRCNWKSFSVLPTKSVEWNELGQRVAGLDPVATADLDLSRLEPGDIIMLLGTTQNPKEPAIATLAQVPVWVWHTGVYSGNGQWIEADLPTVIETDLAAFLSDYAEVYVGIFVTRMSTGPQPKSCRRHAPMSRPPPAAVVAPVTPSPATPAASPYP